MTKNYIGLAVSGTMFPKKCKIDKKDLSLEDVLSILAEGNAVSCVNPQHEATISALREKHGIILEVPKEAPKIFVEKGDSLTVLQVDLPRLPPGRKEYTSEEIAGATFSFDNYTLI